MTISGRKSASACAIEAGRSRSISGRCAQPKTMSLSPAAASRSDRATCPCPPMTYNRIRASGFHEAKALAAVNLVPQGLPPVAAIQIPSDGLLNTRVEGLTRAPSQIGFQLGRVDRIALVVPRTIGHE